MCIPAGALILAGTAVSALGTAAGTMASMQQASYQARVAERNAQMESEAARDAYDRGTLERQRYQRQVSQQMGAQRAALAANGVDVGYGSAAAVQGDAAMIAAEDIATINKNTEREARGFDISAFNARTQAAAARQARSGALVQGIFGIGSTLLGGAQQYRKYQAGQKYGYSNWG